MEPIHTPPINKITTHTFSGINYAELSIDHGQGAEIHFECNCSEFKTVAEVENFIVEVF